jgi:dTDP-4-dehydrorhamnose reductase
MKVLVIGATGQLGQDLLRTFGAGSLGVGHQDMDVTDGVGVMQTLQALKPDWVLNTAAFHRVDDCEVSPAQTFAVNTLGALNVARTTAAIGAGVVFFSTDYVFGADKRQPGRPYLEADLPGPLNVYGASKLAGEQLVMQANPRHLVVRSTGLYGTATSRKGWTFPELMLHKARTEGALHVVHDQVLTPTNTADLAAKVKELIDTGATGLFHLTNAGECSWFDFAREVLELAGVKAKMEPIATQHSGRRAQRPPYSALASSALRDAGLSPMRPRTEALRDYLRAKNVI